MGTSVTYAKPRIVLKNGWWICKGIANIAVTHCKPPPPVRTETVTGRARKPKSAYNAYKRNLRWLIEFDRGRRMYG